MNLMGLNGLLMASFFRNFMGFEWISWLSIGFKQNVGCQIVKWWLVDDEYS